MQGALNSSALDFIKKGPSAPEEAQAADAPPEPEVKKEPSTPPAQEARKPETPKPSKSPKVELPTQDPEDDPLVNVNFRIPSSIAKAILRASMERKLEKMTPHTQQDIAAAALKAWLKKNGHL